MIKAAIIGEMSVTGCDLVRLLINHPDVDLQWIHDPAGVATGRRVDEVFPLFTGDTDLTFTAVPESWDRTDVVFVGGAKAHDALPSDLPEHVRVIDMSPPSLCPEGYTYGLCEINRKFMVHDCYRVAIPSASAMGFLLGVVPLARNLLLGNNVKVTTRLTPCVGIYPDVRAHVAAMPRVLAKLQSSFDGAVEWDFIRDDAEAGIEGVATRITVDCAVDVDMLRGLYSDYYGDHNFAFVTTTAHPIAAVAGTNKCYIHIAREGSNVVIDTIIDARMKGAAGNAVHVMNLLFGLHERVGLAPQL